MKREEFLITSTEGHNVIKHKWNSARKEVARLIQEWVNIRAENELLHILEYNLVKEQFKKDSNGLYHISGVMTWKEKITGKEISFVITKIS